MGTDITCVIEKRNEKTDEWEAVMLYSKNADGSYSPVGFYNGRDYELFGLLAGVRGCSHFGSGVGYLVEPRGLPDGLSKYAENAWDKGIDEEGRVFWHDPTWYDIAELQSYAYLLKDFEKTMKGKDKKIEELEKKIETLKGETETECDWLEYEEYENEHSVVDSFVNFVEGACDVLDAYGVYNPKMGEARIVMWFDS